MSVFYVPDGGGSAGSGSWADIWDDLQGITITTDTNNLALTSQSGWRIVSSSDFDLTGIAQPSPIETTLRALVNTGPNKIKLKNQSTNSLAANRFILPNNSDLELKQDTAIQIIYDTISNRWRVLHVPQH